MCEQFYIFGGNIALRMVGHDVVREVCQGRLLDRTVSSDETEENMGILSSAHICIAIMMCIVQQAYSIYLVFSAV